MTREQLEHLLRASASILINSGSRSTTQELVVIGSQAILGQYPQAPGELLRSMEADLYPLREPELADAIDGAIRKNVGFGNRDIAAVVLDVFRAAERSLLRKSGRATARNERNGLIIAEAPEGRILTGKIMIQADVELAFVDLAHR